MANKRQAKKKRKKTLFDKQWAEVKKSTNLSKKEFREWYENVRRANRKTSRMRRSGRALYAPKFSTSIKGMSTHAFRVGIKKFRSVLERGYRVTTNKDIRNRFNRNIKFIFGGRATSRIRERLGELNDEQFFTWIEENPDLEKIAYDSENGALDYSELADIELGTIESRITW